MNLKLTFEWVFRSYGVHKWVFNECKFMAANILIYTIDFLSQLRGFHEIALCYKIDWSDVVHYTVLKSDTFYKPKFLVFCEILGIERIGCTFVKLCGLVNCRSSVQMKSSSPLPQQRKIHKVTYRYSIVYYLDFHYQTISLKVEKIYPGIVSNLIKIRCLNRSHIRYIKRPMGHIAHLRKQF